VVGSEEFCESVLEPAATARDRKAATSFKGVLHTNCCAMNLFEIATSPSCSVLRSGMHSEVDVVVGKWTTAIPALGEMVSWC
jgi:hypothetical protein